MHQFLKDGAVVPNSWQLVSADTDTPVQGDILLPVSQWQEQRDALANHPGAVGVWIDSHEEIEAFVDAILDLPVIAINFPKFVDGRGFSLARLLRERYEYCGEIRAIGQIIRDQLFFMQRCGFNAFAFETELDLVEAIKSLQDFSDAYQVAVDQPQPLFKRRA
tara:strand:+ start:1223 stop:1711 length:489 start_codon:yes stop_codon:yes gene_type:complete